MVSGLSALGFAPNAPATGQPVYKPVTPRPFNGNSYPLSFQYISRPSSPSLSNGTAFISFIFIALRTLSTATGGYTPLPLFFSPATRFNLLYFLPSIPFSFNDLQNAPPATPLFSQPSIFMGGVPPRTIFVQGPSFSRKIFSPCLGASVANFFPRFRPHCHVSLTGHGGLSILMGFGKT
jgi:hypothetical protein